MSGLIPSLRSREPETSFTPKSTMTLSPTTMEAMDTLDGFLLVPPERGQILGRAMWKVRNRPPTQAYRLLPCVIRPLCILVAGHDNS